MSSNSFKLSTFNCRGLQDNFKRKKGFNYLRNIGSDIIFLQETHCSELITMKNSGKINGANMHGSQITLAIVRGLQF